MKPLILITNDDGIQAEGIHRLVDSVSDLGEIYVVAPNGPKSGGSSSITVEVPLRSKVQDDYNGAKMISVNGTPVDCVKLALHVILPRRPDFVLSGINHGANTGNSVVYSGTMGAAMEGALRGIPSIGYSLISHTPEASDFDRAKPYIRKITEGVIKNGLPDGVCLNVNIPVGREITGIEMTESCRGSWLGEYKEYTCPSGNKFYCLTGTYKNEDPDNPNTDIARLAEGKIAVTPVTPYRDVKLDKLPI